VVGESKLSACVGGVFVWTQLTSLPLQSDAPLNIWYAEELNTVRTVYGLMYSDIYW
jgi:hypothetical protein